MMHLLLISGLLCPAILYAQGGMNQYNNPIFEGGCVAELPPGIDLETCREVPSPDQSGIQVFFCKEIVLVICPSDEG